jgi:integral membrane protein (TIGR01906 family)
MTNEAIATTRTSPRRALLWATLLVVVALPLLLVPLNLRLVVYNLSFYEAQFERYRIEQVTGFSKAELLEASEALLAYFNGHSEPFSYRLRNGQEIYNPREVAHLRDVKALLRLADRIGLVAGVALAAALAFQFRTAGRLSFAAIGRSLALGSLATLGLLAGVALLALADFSGAFLQFHYLAFSNDLWQLDPRTDNLIRMFPEGFFFDATLLLAIGTAVEAVLLLGMGLFLRIWAAGRAK